MWDTFDGLNMNSQSGPQMESSYGFREFIMGSDPIKFSSPSPQVLVGEEIGPDKGRGLLRTSPPSARISKDLLQPGSDSPYSSGFKWVYLTIQLF